MVSEENEAQRYINDIARERGYVLDYHKVMAQNDLDTLKAVNTLVSAAYLNQRNLDRRTKELLFVLSLTILRAPAAQIASHIRVALDLGVTSVEILEAIEISLPEAGIVAFQHGFDVWREVVGAQGIEATVVVHDEGKSTK